MKRNDAYHHGNLRAALLEAAHVLINEVGVEALTLRAVARRAGVSTGAPYHHFVDKAALVAELARQSLDELDRIAGEALSGIDKPDEQLYTLGMVYVLYAVDHPAEFRVMFRPDKGAPFDTSGTATEPIFVRLMSIVKACRIAAGSATDGHETAAIAAWSLVHGLAALLIDGPLAALVSDREHLHTLIVSITNRIDVT